MSNSKLRKTVAPQVTIDAINERLSNEACPDMAALNLLVQRTIMLDRKLGFALESEVGSVIAEAIDAAFQLGWQYCRQPELLIFKGGDE